MSITSLKLALLVGLALSSVSSTAALAQEGFLADTKKPLESPRSMFLEAKVSYFLPNIDSTLRAAGVPESQLPYYAAFGSGWMLLGEIEVDYQFFQKFGSLGAGLSFGYTEKFGKAIDVATGDRTDQSTGMRLFPIKVLLVYRWDYAKIRWNVPVVPYVKVAFVAMPWWVSNGKEVEEFGVSRGSGVTFGLAETFGLALQLDFLDPRLARDFDSSLGVNHTYLFAEGTLQQMNLFNATSTRPLDFSSQHFLFGLGFEF